MGGAVFHLIHICAYFCQVPYVLVHLKVIVQRMDHMYPMQCMCVHDIILIIKYRKCCFMSVFHPPPPIMYITFPGAWFMQILVCVPLLNVVSAG